MSFSKTPVWLHQIRGSYRPNRHAKREGELWLSTGQIGQPPSFVTRDPTALSIWEQLTRDSEYRRLLSPLFNSLLAEYCALSSRAMSDPDMPVGLRKHLASLRSELWLAPIFRGRWPEAVAATLEECDDMS